jgi:mRNA interferase RelE/StbE
MVVAAPVAVPDILPRLQSILRGVRAAHQQSPTSETARLLEEMENFVEDMMDLQDSLDSLNSVSSPSDVTSWEDLQAELGL